MESEDKTVKQLIEKLKETGIMSVIANGVSIHDTDFKILYQNQMAKDFLGDHVGEYCYKSYMRRALACDDCSQRQGFSDGNFHKVEKSVATDNGVLHLEITVAPLRDSKGNIIAGIEVLNDITERKKREEALKSSEKNYRELIDNAIIGVYKTNFKGDILYVNKALSNIFEFESPEEMMRYGVLKLYKNPKDRESLIEKLKKTGKVDNFEIEVLTKEGKNKYILLNATLVANVLLGMIIDITKRKQTEVMLRENEEMFHGLIDAIFEGVIIYAEDQIMKANKSFAKMFGYEFNEVIGKSASEFVTPESYKLIKRNIQHGYEKLYEIKGVKKNGTTFELEAIGTNCRYNGRGARVVAMCNITDRKEAEKALQKTQIGLEERIKVRTTELEETNIALRILLKQRENDKSKFENNILSNIKLLILPYLAKLKRIRSTPKELSYLNILGSNLKEIISPFSVKLSSKYLGLTPKEIQIANLIKDGKSNKDILEMLNVSFDTVKTHRQNIRKKLGILKKSINLRVYLLSLT